MKRKLYFVIEKQSHDVGDDIQELTGWKTVTVYEIVDNEPKNIFDLELSNSDDTEEYIQGYLDDNDFEGEFEFNQL
jgi:hypothetical protein